LISKFAVLSDDDDDEDSDGGSDSDGGGGGSIKASHFQHSTQPMI